MKNIDIIKLAVQFFMRDKTRSLLTVIGIILGIATIMLVVGIAEGFSKDVEKEFEGFGNDKIFVTPSSGSGFSSPFRGAVGKLFKRDFEAVENLRGIKYAAYLIANPVKLQYKDKIISSYLVGISGPDFFKGWGPIFTIDSGRFLKENDGYSMLLEYSAARDLFDEELKLGDKITAGEKDFKVVGTLKKQGGALSSGQDTGIYITEDKAREIFGESLAEGEITAIYLTVEDEKQIDEIKKQVEEKIARKHKVNLDDKDFSVFTSEYIRKTAGSILDTISLASIVIAAIASIIGGIGISNTMVTSVIEKRKEIGILRAIGAKENEILKIFLAESAITGVIGSILGIAISILLSLVVKAVGISFSFNLAVMVLAVIYGMAVGIASGYFPAKQAMKISPIEAITYD